MSQITISLNPSVERKLKAAAKKRKVSISRWISEMIEKNNSPEWPEEVKKLAGAWNNFSLTNELRSDLGFDSEREHL